MNDIKSLAALKRALTTGTVLDVTQHRFPELTGRRTVVKVNTTGVYLSLPDGHPAKDSTNLEGSFAGWPKAKDLTIHGDGTFTIGSPDWGDDLMTFAFAQDQGTPASGEVVDAPTRPAVLRGTRHQQMAAAARHKTGRPHARGHCSTCLAAQGPTRKES